jgi:protein ImuB
MPRIACFLVPLFPLAARLRSEPSLAGDAVVVVDGNGSAAHVVAATRKARKKGIRPGQSLPQARSILPRLIARGRDPECERTAQEALLDVAETFSPRVEDAGDGVAYVDVTGMEKHFSDRRDAQRASDIPVESSDTDEGIRRALRVPTWEHSLGCAAIQAADAIGLPLRVGIAASKLAARVAAELPESPQVVPAGKEIEFLAPLPLTRLAPEIDAAAMLQRWGIESIGQFAHLPESAVASRLGEMGRELHWSARGIDPRPLTPRQLPPEFREGMELEWPLVAIEPFCFIANAALDRLTKRLEIQGFACRRLELDMTLEPDGHHARAIDLPAPTRDVKSMLTLLRLDLEASPPGAPVVGFSIIAHPDRPRRAQLSLFGPAALSQEKLATAIARIAAMIGEDRIGSPAVVDGHLPERFAITDYAPPPPPELKCGPRKSRGLLAVRVFRPPIPIEVITREAREGEPPGLQIVSISEQRIANSEQERGQIRSSAIDRTATTRIVRSDPQSSKKTIIEGTVKVCSGPWRLEEGWWRDAPADRQYWDVELLGGGVYRVYHDERSEDWYADAMYD